MSLALFFDAARNLKRELAGGTGALTQDEVDALNAVIGTWKQAAPSNPITLADAGAFFAGVRASFGALGQSQVDGIQALLHAFGIAQWPIPYAAYGLATAWRETNDTMQPVREAYWLSDDWRKANLKYYPWYGRGFCQCTWEKNYQRADDELGLAGALITDPDKALEPDIAAMIMVRGMAEGWFSGKKLGDYLPADAKADIHQFTNARWIINGQDHAVEIAEHALKFQDALASGGWA